MTIETVKIWRDNPRKAKTINKADFDPSIHVLYDPELPPAPAPDPEHEPEIEKLKPGPKPKQKL